MRFPAAGAAEIKGLSGFASKRRSLAQQSGLQAVAAAAEVLPQPARRLLQVCAGRAAFADPVCQPAAIVDCITVHNSLLLLLLQEGSLLADAAATAALPAADALTLSEAAPRRMLKVGHAAYNSVHGKLPAAGAYKYMR
jgi:hypothetical protein